MTERKRAVKNMAGEERFDLEVLLKWIKTEILFENFDSEALQDHAEVPSHFNPSVGHLVPSIISHFVPKKSHFVSKVMHLSMLSPRVGGAGYPREFDSESLPQGRDFDTCRYPRVGNLTCPPSWKTERTWK